MYSYVLFDLDGTLTDPGVGITNSVMYALSKYGITVNDRSELYPFIGPPLDESFMKYFGFKKEECTAVIEKYREYFKDTGIFENEVYDGVPEMLTELKKAGCTLILATSKPQTFAERILDHFGLREYFTFVAGATLDGSRIKKADVIAYALRELGIRDISSCLMVGDREHDLVGAAANGMDAVGVLYGYGSREELEAVRRVFLAETPEDLADFIKGTRK